MTPHVPSPPISRFPWSTADHCFEPCHLQCSFRYYADARAWEEYYIYRRNPDFVLVDTAVIAKSPARHLVAGMGDALPGLVRSAFALTGLCDKTLLADGVSPFTCSNFVFFQPDDRPTLRGGWRKA